MKTGESYIFRAIGSLLFFLINVFSVYLLLRGHNLPGGGFIGGLGTALSLLMLSLAFGVQRTQEILRVDPVRLALGGLSLAGLTALLPLFVGDPFLRHYHAKLEHLPVVGTIEIGTPLVFDIGVFLVVVGVTAKLIFVLARPNAGLTALAPAEWERYAARLERPIETQTIAEPSAGEDEKEERP